MGRSMSISLIVLAAGRGTRMKSDRPKVLHELAGVPLLYHALAAGAELGPVRTVLIAGHGMEEVAKAARERDPAIKVMLQEKQLGTAHAVAQARPALKGFYGDAVVIYGDTPFIGRDTLLKIRDARTSGSDVVVLGFEAADPGRYGRLVTEHGRLERIVEYESATAEEREIRLCNSGVLCAEAVTLFDLVDAVGDGNAAGEHYLTDIVAIARSRGLSSTAVICGEEETLGVNTREELAVAEARFQARARREAMEAGISLTDPDTVRFALDTAIGGDATVEPYVIFGPGVTVESGARIRAFSHLEGCHVGAGAVVGPFARLRPESKLGNGAKVGNFVELKNTEIGEGTKVNHLSYFGDASIGASSNIGTGSSTCNYDGFAKNRTEIGEGAFIGSGNMLVAPVRVGKGAMTGAGSVITQDVPDHSLAVGRARQVVKDGAARRLFDLYKSRAENAKKEN